VGKLAMCIEQDICRICEANTSTRGALKVRGDHVHLFLSAPPSIAPSQIAHTLKNTTGRRFPDVKTRLFLLAVGRRRQCRGEEHGYGAHRDRVRTKSVHSSDAGLIVPDMAGPTGRALESITVEDEKDGKQFRLSEISERHAADHHRTAEASHHC